MYDLQEIKSHLSDNQIFELLEYLGGEPYTTKDAIISKTICHCGETHKLYYYYNTQLFKCYTDCGGEAWDVFELVQKVKSRMTNLNYSIVDAINFIVGFFNISDEYQVEQNNSEIFEYLESINKYSKINIQQENRVIEELKEYDNTVLTNLPKVQIIPWMEENISQAAMDKFNIGYEPKHHSIVIPHKDINGRLVGIRQRTLIQENAIKYGKYIPLKIGGINYRHPLSFNLYGLYENKDNIRKIKKAIIFESEKSVLQLNSILENNNIGVACCGSSVSAYQIELLKQLDVNEIVIGFDKQFQSLGDDEHKKLVANLKNIQHRFGTMTKVTFMFDKENILPYKASPTDCGKDIFLHLFNNRINIY